MLKILGYRISNAFLTFPSLDDCILIFVLLLGFSLIVIPFGFKSNFLEIENSQITFKTIFRTILIALFFPAIVEEVFFRVLFLAHSTENTSIFNQYFFVIISLMIFVVYHPLNAYLFVYNARKTFNSFVFLTSAAILGIVCTIAYLKSGSIYPPVIIHWIIVIFWLLIFGGYRKLYL